MKKSIGKRIAVLAAIGVMTMTSTSAVFAMDVNKECTYFVMQDNVAEAHLNSDYSGYILIKDTSIWDTENGLTQIAGTPLGEIIETVDGGKIESIKNSKCGGWCDYSVDVYGKGGSNDGFGKNIHMKFTDGTNDYHTLTVCRTSMNEHSVCYNSDDYKITKIEWYQSTVLSGYDR